MKKFIAVFLTIAMMAIALPFAANAQTNSRYYRSKPYKSYRYKKKDKNIYEKHRNIFNIGIGGAAGAIIGGIIGGKKGALIGAGVGAGTGAAYTYGINPKDKKKKKRYRRYRRP